MKRYNMKLIKIKLIQHMGFYHIKTICKCKNYVQHYNGFFYKMLFFIFYKGT